MSKLKGTYIIGTPDTRTVIYKEEVSKDIRDYLKKSIDEKLITQNAAVAIMFYVGVSYGDAGVKINLKEVKTIAKFIDFVPMTYDLGEVIIK